MWARDKDGNTLEFDLAKGQIWPFALMDVGDTLQFDWSTVAGRKEYLRARAALQTYSERSGDSFTVTRGANYGAATRSIIKQALRPATTLELRQALLSCAVRASDGRERGSLVGTCLSNAYHTPWPFKFMDVGDTLDIPNDTPIMQTLVKQARRYVHVYGSSVGKKFTTKLRKGVLRISRAA